MSISAWWLLPAAVPVLMVGELLVRRVAVLGRYHIPVPVVGGLLVALLLLVLHLAGVTIELQTRVSAMWWTWISLPEVEWIERPQQAVHVPFVVAFFTCIGLNASWSVARRGSWQLLLFLGLAAVLALLQGGLGLALAGAMDVSPYLGLLCGTVSMTGGHGTALGFTPTFEQAGFAQAGVVGAAAATFGLVFGSLVGGPVAGRLIRRRSLAPANSDTPTRVDVPHPAEADAETNPLPVSPARIQQARRRSFITEAGMLVSLGSVFVIHLLILLACMKIGAWVSFGLRELGLTFPVYMGSMLMGIFLRNLLDGIGRPIIRTEVVELMASVLLGIFLAIAMMSLNLAQLLDAALPMLAILACQVVLMVFFAYFVIFNLMGRDFEAAVMAGGHCGFGLGATPNAVANMEALSRRFGHAPRAFLIVTIVGAFLIDFTNALTITMYLNLIGWWF